MFHVEHFPNFLFLMALDIVQYKSGDPITAGVTYQILGEMNSEAWILQSTTQGAVFQMTATAPTDEDWSNIQDTQFHINGTVTGLILPILSNGYFRVVKEPVTEHATMALVEQEFQMEVADPINPFVAGTPVAPGYYDLSSLNLEAGKMYVLSVLPEQDKDYPQTPGIVTDETFSAVIVGLTGTKATQVILRGVTTVGSHLFVMTGAKPILHLGGRSNVKFNITVSPVVFSAGGGSFDPSQPATITGLWDLQNVSGINLVDEGPIILGKGDNAVKIHGSGTGSAVIEGANGATLDIAVPVDFSEPITYQDTVSYNRVGTTGEPIFQRWVMPRATLTLKGFEGAFGFANADGSQNYIGIDVTGNVSFLKNTNHSGASTFSAGVTMGQTLTVTGRATMNGGIILPNKDLFLGPSTRFIAETGNNLELRIDAPDGSFTVPYLTTKASAGTSSGNLEVGGAANVQGNLTVTLDAALNRNILMGPVTISRSANMLNFSSPVTFQGAMTFNAGVTMAQSLNCSSVLQVASNLYLGDSIQTNTDLGKFTSANLKFQNTADSTEDLQLLTDAGGVYIRIARENFYMASADPDPTDVLSVKEMDARYAKLGTTTTATLPAVFTGTTDSALKVTGDATFSKNLNVTGSLYLTRGFQMGEALFSGPQGTSASMVYFRIDPQSTEYIYLNTDSSGVEFKITRDAPPGGTPQPSDVLNTKEMDARYAKVVTTTKAAYTALATKDPTTIYLITDTTPRMWAIGDMEIVTADVPA